MARDESEADKVQLISLLCTTSSFTVRIHYLLRTYGRSSCVSSAAGNLPCSIVCIHHTDQCGLCSLGEAPTDLGMGMDMDMGMGMGTVRIGSILDPLILGAAVCSQNHQQPSQASRKRAPCFRPESATLLSTVHTVDPCMHAPPLDRIAAPVSRCAAS